MIATSQNTPATQAAVSLALDATGTPPGSSAESWVGWVLLALGGLALMLHLAGADRGGPLARRAPRVWWCLYGLPVTLVRVAVTWRRLMDGCALAVVRKPARALLGRHLIVRGEPLRPVPPRGAGLRLSTCGLVLDVVMHPGQVPDQYTAAAEALAHAWRVHAVRVTCPRRGHVRLALVPLDPLHGQPARAVIPRQRARHAPATTPTKTPAVPPVVPPGELLRVTIGVREDARPWVIDLRRVPHWLIAGVTQSGKSTLVNALVCGLAPRPVALVGIDCKGGMELAPYERRLSALASTRSEAAGLLDALVGDLAARMRLCRTSRARNIWELPDPVRPVPVVVIIDELAELYLMATRADKDEVAAVSTALVRLGQLGAALGVHLVVSGQRVGSDLGPGVTALRAQLSGRVCHRVNDKDSAEMTLNELHPDALVAALAITPADQGVAVTADDTGAWIRARSHLVTTSHAEHAATTWAHLTPNLPALTTSSTTPYPVQDAIPDAVTDPVPDPVPDRAADAADMAADLVAERRDGR